MNLLQTSLAFAGYGSVTVSPQRLQVEPIYLSYPLQAAEPSPVGVYGPEGGGGGVLGFGNQLPPGGLSPGSHLGLPHHPGGSPPPPKSIVPLGSSSPIGLFPTYRYWLRSPPRYPIGSLLINAER